MEEGQAQDRSMTRKIQEDWDSATDGRDTLLYMFKNAIT